MGGARVEPSLTGGGRTSPGLTSAGLTTSARTGGPAAASAHTLAPSAGIPADAVTAAQSVLTFFVGPIARVLVRDAAAQAASPRDFIDRLCAHVSKPEELTALRRRLRAEVEPRMR
jgi:eukaryotic-like serine/threonine-protein kinase